LPRKNKPEYRGFSLPVPFIERIEEIVNDDPHYRSIADFVKDAIDEKINSHIFEQTLHDYELIIYRNLMAAYRFAAIKEAETIAAERFEKYNALISQRGLEKEKSIKNNKKGTN
jgi:hypothetical protein